MPTHNPDQNSGLIMVLSPANTTCDNENCGEKILRGADVFMDIINSSSLCRPCGERLRYHRKKWSERGWAMPKTLKEVEETFRRLGLGPGA